MKIKIKKYYFITIAFERIHASTTTWHSADYESLLPASVRLVFATSCRRLDFCRNHPELERLYIYC